MRVVLQGAIYQLANALHPDGVPQFLTLAHEIDGVGVEGTSGAEVLSALADYLQGKIIPQSRHQLYYEQALFLVTEALGCLNKIDLESDPADKITHFTTAPGADAADIESKEVQHAGMDGPEQKNAGYDPNYDVAFDRKVNDASTEGPAL